MYWPARYCSRSLAGSCRLITRTSGATSAIDATRPVSYTHLPVRGRLRYLLRPLTLIDLLVLATVASPVDLRALLTLRLFRLLHVMGLDLSLIHI